MTTVVAPPETLLDYIAGSLEKAAEYNSHWGRYRKRTSREIPLVLLEPR